MHLKCTVENHFLWDEKLQDFVQLSTEIYWQDNKEITKEEYYKLLEQWQEQAQGLDPEDL